jgi:hypothetical protein
MVIKKKNGGSKSWSQPQDGVADTLSSREGSDHYRFHLPSNQDSIYHRISYMLC